MGKADPTSAPQGSRCPRSGGDAACFTALDPSQNRGCSGHYLTNPLHHNRPRSHRGLSRSGLNCCTWLLFEMTAHDTNPTQRLWTDNSITHGSDKRRHHNNLCAHYSPVCFQQILDTLFYPNRVLSLNSTSHISLCFQALHSACYNSAQHKLHKIRPWGFLPPSQYSGNEWNLWSSKH